MDGRMKHLDGECWCTCGFDHSMEGYKIEDGHRYDEYLFMEFFLKDKLHKLIYHKRRQIRELNVKMIKLRIRAQKVLRQMHGPLEE